jgi:hypothetical protein
MPYIKSGDGRREALQKGDPALNAGELNYQMFYYVKHYYEHVVDPYYQFLKDINKCVKKFLGDKPNYQRYNDMTGAIIRCYKEVYRRLHLNLREEFLEVLNSYDDEIAKYEDTKIVENGDVE